MTGSFLAGATLGDQTFSERQSSPSGSLTRGREPGGRGACGQTAPKALASRVPVHPGAGWGARQRRSPTGGAAKGMFLKTEIFLSVVPDSAPCAIVTCGPTAAGSACADVAIRTENTAVSASACMSPPQPLPLITRPDFAAVRQALRW